MTELAEARDIINNMVTAAWDTNNPIEYQDKILDPLPSADECWGRVTIKHNLFGQASFADGTGKKRFDRSGSLIIQVFTPPNDGLTKSDQITLSLLDAFEGKTDSAGAIWFRESYINEVGISGAHYQANFITSFYYTHIK